MVESSKGRMSLSRRNLLFVTAGVLGLLLVGRTVGAWYVNYQHQLDATIELKVSQYEKVERLKAQSQQYAELSEALDRFTSQVAEKRFIIGGSTALSEVKFQNIVKQLASETKVNIRSLKTMPLRHRDGLSFLNLSINARAEIGAIQNFIASVQNNEKHIYFESFEIKRINTSERRFYYFNAQLTALTQS